MLKTTTPDIVIPGEKIDQLVKKVITNGFKKNNKLKQKDIEFYNRQVYLSIKDAVSRVMKEEYCFEEVRDLIFQHLVSKYSWDKLLEMGIKE